MKIIDLPTRLFETGDRVLTPDGKGTVVHDELEGIDEDCELRLHIAEHSHERDVVIVRLDKPNSDDRQEQKLDRNDLIYPLEA